MSQKPSRANLVTDMEAPRVTMVVPVVNNLDLTKRLVESIRRFVQIPYKIVFVDNGSRDGTREYLDLLARSNPTRIEVIHNHTNKGFAHATNQGMERVKGHMLWLNNDVEFVRHGTLETLVEILESAPTVGAVGPVTDAALGPQIVTEGVRYPDFHSARFLVGFFLLVKEEVWRKVGKLDEGFNNAGQDDLDYSIRIRKAGYSLGIGRRVFVHHMGGASQPPRDQYRIMERESRKLLVNKWGEETVNELFLPINLNNVRVMMAVPVWDKVTGEAYGNHMGMMLEEMRHANETNLQIEFAPLLRSSVVPARNELVRMALRRDCSHLLFMDDDMLMPPRAIHRMIERDVDIVSGLCFLRTPPHFPSAFMDPNDADGKIYYLKSWPENQMFRVDAVGSACVLIKTDVFRKIQEMEVKGNDNEVIKKAGQDLWYLYGKARPGEHTVGEDVFFCKLARQAGFQIWVDSSLEFGHIGYPVIFDSRFFQEQGNGRSKDLPGIPYQDYESALAMAAGPQHYLTPDKLADLLGGDRGEESQLFRRLHAGVVGDGKYPGPASAASNAASARRSKCSPV